MRGTGIVRRICCGAMVILLVLMCSASWAEQGNDADAMYQHAFNVLVSEDSTQEEIEQAVAEMESAAQMGSFDATWLMGVMYENGYFVTQDYSTAAQWYYACVMEFGSFDATYKLAYFTQYGLGLDQDMELAVQGYQIAAEYGILDAAKALANIYLEEIEDPEKAQLAKSYLEQAASLGDHDSMFLLAHCYENAWGTEKDYRQATQWLANWLGMTTDETMYYGQGQDKVQKIISDALGEKSVAEDFCREFYETIWVRKHSGTEEFWTTKYNVIVLSALYPQYTQEQISNAAIACIDWMYSLEPDLLTQTENYQQYSTGSPVYEKRTAISQQFFNKGYELFEKGDFLAAIECYQYCVDTDPRDVTPRFEIAECYLWIGRLEEAKAELKNLAPYVVWDADKAHYYRRVGYIAIDEEDYELGGACMLYSQKFYKTERALKEMEYIEYLTGAYPEYTDEEIQVILKDRDVWIWDAD